MAGNLENMFLPTLPDSTMDGNYSAEPKLIIREQPKSKFRFRYKNEGTTHGVLPGATPKSAGRKKTFPSVEIVNHIGVARIVVSLVTDEQQPKLHAHSLVGKDCSNGICTVQVEPTDMTACFQTLMIEHATKKDSVPILKRRILENQEICNQLGYGGIDQVTEEHAQEQARDLAKDMDLSKVRLCFQGYLKDPVSGKFVNPLPQVVSNVIWNINAPHTTTLKICRMDRSSGCAKGAEEVYLLCDKVQKDDVEVRFFEVGPSEELIWEGFGDFGPTDVHRQYAIVFRTPRFRETSISKPVEVRVQLRRKTDGEVSEPKPFTYYPPVGDVEGLKRKRFKPCMAFTTAKDELLRNCLPNNGNNKFTPNMDPSFVFGNPTDQKDIQCLMQCNVPDQPSTSEAQLYGPAVAQPQVNGGPVSQQPCVQQLTQQHQVTQQQQLPQQQLPQQQQSNLQTQQLLSQGQMLSPEQLKQQRILLQYHQMKQLQMLQGNHQGGFELQQHSEGALYQMQADLGLQQQKLQQNVQPMSNGELQKYQIHQMQAQQQALVQQNGHQNVFGMPQNRPRASLARRGNKQKVTVKKEHPEPLECKELKEYLPDVEMKSNDSDCFKVPGLEFPTTDIRSDACPLSSSGIEDDSSISEKASYHANQTQLKMGRTAEWAYSIGKFDKSPPPNDMQCVIVEEFGHEDKTVQTDPTVNYEKEVFELGRRLLVAMLAYSQTGDCRILLQAQRHLCNIDDENGDTPLHLAVIHKQPEALHTLLSVVVTIEGQRIVDQKNKLNQTPLQLAVILGYGEMVSLLLRCGADPNTLDHQGYTSLHLAVEEKFHEGLEILMAGPTGEPVLPLVAVDKDTRNLDGYTALHMAVMKGDIDAARSLVSHGADRNIPDGKSGRVPLHHAVVTENFAMLSYLVADARVDIEAEDFAGNTPLHIASAHDLRAVAALLIAAGASPDRRNCDIVDESDDSSTDEGYDNDEDDGDDERIGSSPLDYAKSDQMKRVLLGENYIPLAPGAFERTSDVSSSECARSDYSSCPSAVDQSDAPRHQSRLQTLDSGIRSRSLRSEGGDILSLPSSCVRLLAQTLDIPSSDSRDWKAVASSLGMGNMINHLRSFDSPAKVLLEQYALMDGTLLELLQVLKNLRRDDAVEIIKNTVNQMRK